MRESKTIIGRLFVISVSAALAGGASPSAAQSQLYGQQPRSASMQGNVQNAPWTVGRATARSPQDSFVPVQSGSQLLPVQNEAGVADPAIVYDEPAFMATSSEEFLEPQGGFPGRIRVEAGVLFLSRTRGSESKTLVVNDATGAPVLTTSGLDLDFERGPYVAASVLLSRRSSVDVSFFDLDKWQPRTIVRGLDNLSLPGDVSLPTMDFFGADEVRVAYTSDLDHYEANYRHSFEHAALLIGFRHVRLAEEMQIQSADLDSGRSDYFVNTRNRLYGGQFGLTVPVLMERLAIVGIGKVGGYYNDAEQTTFLGDFNNTFIFRNSSTSGSTVSLIGEVGVNSSLQVTRWLSLHAGYRFIWIRGLALAPDQLDFTDTPVSGTQLVDGGNLFLHGAQGTVEIHWGGGRR